MPLTLAFDVYGTLIDTQGVLAKLDDIVGLQAKAFSNTWREKQLEYSFRRGLMKQYKNFAICTADALNYTASVYKVSLDNEQKESLLQSYRTLPAFTDVTDGLTSLKCAGVHLYAFSNGSAEAVETLLKSANIHEFFDGVVSVDEIQSFKPDPAVYHHLLKKTNSKADSTWLISSNPFDVIGALSVDMRAAWVQRSADSIFDPWGIEPTVTVSGLLQLNRAISNRAG